MPELHDYIWMRQQWRRFRRLLLGAQAAVFLVGGSGLVVLQPTEEDPLAWFYVRLALMLLLSVSAVVTVWLLTRATREIAELKRQISEARLEARLEARQAKRSGKKRRRGS